MLLFFFFFFFFCNIRKRAGSKINVGQCGVLGVAYRVAIGDTINGQGPYRSRSRKRDWTRNANGAMVTIGSHNVVRALCGH